MKNRQTLQVLSLALVLGSTGWAQVTKRISVSAAGVQGNGDSYYTSISGDGRSVAFQSDASNLITWDTNGKTDVYYRAWLNSYTEIDSVDSSAGLENDSSGPPSISADGRFVAFSSFATNLVPGDTNGQSDVILRNRSVGTTQRVSVSSGGVEGNSGSYSPSISADGRYVAFSSFATNLVPGDTNGVKDVFLRDRMTGTTLRVSLSGGGVQGNGDSDYPSISADGLSVAFESDASNLIGWDTNGKPDVYYRAWQNSYTEIVSVDTSANLANDASGAPSISADGRYVAFSSSATNLVLGDGNGKTDVFVRSRSIGTTEIVSLSSDGVQGNDSSSSPSISADGRYVAFVSSATNLVSADTNGHLDIFLRDRNATGFTSLCEPGVGGVRTCPCSNPPGSSGRGCNNSSATGGAFLTASGIAYLSTDSLVFTTYSEKPAALSIVLQGNALVSAGVVYGQGVRCVGGTLERLFTKTASAGSITAPDVSGGDPTVSARSAAKGDPIQPGQSRWYLVYYRDPIVLGGCPASRTFNATQTGEVSWWP